MLVPFLEERDNLRLATFRVDGAGAEKFTTLKDVDYAAGQNAFLAARLIIRDQAALSIAVGDLRKIFQSGQLNEANFKSFSTTRSE
jgi:hypothetical protein